MNIDWVYALVGGGLIGIAATILLLWNGRICGISGILFGVFKPILGETSWRFMFLLGLLISGLVFWWIDPSFFQNNLSTPTYRYILAGLIVGIGTNLGSGCTSGHGVCGISRLSVRSIIATLTFMFFGIVTVYILNHL